MESPRLLQKNDSGGGGGGRGRGRGEGEEGTDANTQNTYVKLNKIV